MGKRLLLCGLFGFQSGWQRRGAFARKEKFQFGKKCEAKSWNDMEIIPPPREFVGRLFVCLFVFSEPLQLPYGRGWGPGIHTKTRPLDNSKIAFYCHLWLRPKLQQCYQILFEGDVYFKCILLARNVVSLKLDGWTFSYYGRRGGTSKTSNSIPIKM